MTLKNIIDSSMKIPCLTQISAQIFNNPVNILFHILIITRTVFENSWLKL